ncbi:MAG: ABC transporter ATP-binding protein [Candidatus Delongbacteria bacterium]|nr:ABC transporter ATP-binding protein [Candidatus Delongbacteria bacterium]MBN2833473.1 ABC transporter ATP-binding protein [Candidatus Delongbacteria bacterium]
MLSVNELNYKYDNNREYTLKSVCFDVYPGNVLLVTGLSGCGKSTLVNCLNGLNPKHYGGKIRGSIRLDGEELINKEIWQFSQNVGTVFQNPASQFFYIKILHELAFGLEYQMIETEDIKKSISNISKKMNIISLLEKNIFSLSSGEKQRVAISSVMLTDQKLLIFDEPTANLDLEGIKEFRKIIKKLKGDGKIIIIVEHRISYLKDIADEVMIMNEGKVLDILSKLEFNRLSEYEELRRNEYINENLKSISSRSRVLYHVENLSYRFKDKIILDKINYDFRRGVISALTGKNGAGKTTFARVLCGLLKRKEGKIKDLENDKYLNSSDQVFGYVSQFADQQLFTDSVYDEIYIGCKLPKHTEEILKEFDLLEKKNMHPHSLSGGEKQRTAIAAMIAVDYNVLILDEPTSGMDGRRLNILTDKLLRLSNLGYSILIITHDPELIQKCCNEILWLEDGKLEEISYTKFYKELEI